MSNPLILKILEDIAKDLSGQVVDFPTFLDIALRVRSALRDPDVNMEKLARLVSVEPLMSAQIIRIANSVALNPTGIPVTDIKSAIVRVGTEAVRAVSFSVAMKQMLYGKEMLVFGDLPQHLWEHSIYTAVLCKALARRLRKNGGAAINEEEALFAGLVHDIGAFYLLFRAIQYPALTQDSTELNDFLADWHSSIGHTLLTALGQSPSILAAVEEHEQERSIETVGNISDLLYVANKFANLISPWRKHLEAGDSDILAQLFDAETLQELIGESETEMESLKQALLH